MRILGREAWLNASAEVIAAIAGLVLLAALLSAWSSTSTPEVTLGTAFEQELPVPEVDGRPPLVIRTLQPAAPDVRPVTPDRAVGVFTLIGLGLIGGVPMIMGAWTGGFVYSPVWSVFFLAIGIGVPALVVGQIVWRMTRGGSMAWMLAPASEAQALDSDAWIIDASRAGFRDRLHEFWRYRRVLSYFSVNAVKRMYKGTTLGVFWLFARPLLPILISAFIFGALLQVGSDGVPYFLFFLTGMCTWMILERGLRFVSRSFDQSSSLLKKVYFPRLIAPFAALLPAVVNFGIYLGLLVVTAVYYLLTEDHWYLLIGPRLLLGAIAVFLAMFFTVSVGLWTSVWMAWFPDLKFGLRYITRFWFYATPVIYPMSQVPPEHRWLVYVNPMAPLVETFKWSILGVGEFPVGPLLTSGVVIALVFAGGVWYFGRAEAAIIDSL